MKRNLEGARSINKPANRARGGLKSQTKKVFDKTKQAKLTTFFKISSDKVFMLQKQDKKIYRKNLNINHKNFKNGKNIIELFKISMVKLENQIINGNDSDDGPFININNA